MNVSHSFGLGLYVDGLGLSARPAVPRKKASQPLLPQDFTLRSAPVATLSGAPSQAAALLLVTAPSLALEVRTATSFTFDDATLWDDGTGWSDAA